MRKDMQVSRESRIQNSESRMGDRSEDSAFAVASSEFWILNSGFRSSEVSLLSLFDREVGLIGQGAGVLRTRTDQAVVGVLLDDVSGPTGDPAHSEDRCVKIYGDSQHVVC